MRGLVFAMAFGIMASACGRSPGTGTAVPVAPSPVPTPPPAAAADAVLTVTSFSGQATPGGVVAEFTLSETSGQSGVIVEALRFEDSAGHADLVDAWCLGDDGIWIRAFGSIDAKSLGYCRPVFRADVVSYPLLLTVTFKQPDGRRGTVQASTDATK